MLFFPLLDLTLYLFLPSMSSNRSPSFFLATHGVNQMWVLPRFLQHIPWETWACHGKNMVVARNKGLLKQWFMLGHSPGCGCLCFLAGTCKATQNKNYLMLYYSTALLQTWKKPLFWREEGECHFILLIRKSTHMSISHKQRRMHLPRGHSFRKTPSSSLQFSIHFQLTFITVEMLETLDNLPAPLHSGKTCKGRGHSIIGYRV